MELTFTRTQMPCVARLPVAVKMPTKEEPPEIVLLVESRVLMYAIMYV